MNLADKESPFQPGKPVDPNKFEGRIENIKEVLRYLNQVSSGKSQHFFLTGKRGMGKSSFARYIGNEATKEKEMIYIHLYLDGISDINELTKEIIAKIYDGTEKSLRERIFKPFKKKVKSVNAQGFGFGLGVELNLTKEENLAMTNNFAKTLIEIMKNAKYDEPDGKNGIVIVIDDINGLTKKPDFANWYKSFADTLSTDFEKAPIFMILSGLPEKKEILFNHNESFSRIFHYTELEILTDTEIEEFYKTMFNEVGMEVKDAAMEMMVEYCSGLPTMMHEIGEAVFWEDIDFIIDERDASMGILTAGRQIGDKYLKPIVNSKIRSNEYLSIFKKLGDHAFFSLKDRFSKKDLENVLDEKEMKVFKGFLQRAKDLGIIEFAGAKKSGAYKFTNNLYPIYFMIQNLDKATENN